jgi:outer membrane murein-binding lipoprotein Lpp
VRALFFAARHSARASRAIARPRSSLLGKRSALSVGVCCAALSLAGCSVTNRMDRMNAHIEEMNDRMAQLNDRVENLNKAVEKLDETNKRLGDLRDQGSLMAKELSSIERVVRKYGGSTSLGDTTPSQPAHGAHPSEPAQAEGAIEPVSEPATLLGPERPPLAEPVSASEPSESPRSAEERSVLRPPTRGSVLAAEDEPAPSPAQEIVELRRVERRVGMCVITLR